MISRVLKSLIALVVVLYLIVCAAVFFYQRSLIYFAQPRALGEQASLRLNVQGTEVVVTVHESAGPKAIIYFGGNGEDVSGNLEVFRQWFPGHSLYLMHYRGYGGSQGRPSEAAIHADAAALFDYVRAATSRNCGGRAQGLGSGVAVRLASTHEVSRLVLITPYDSIQAVASAVYPFLPVKWLLVDKFESDRYAPQVRANTLILAASDDTVIPPERTEALYRAFQPGRATMTVIPGTGHNTIQNSAAYGEAMRRAMP